MKKEAGILFHNVTIMESYKYYINASLFINDLQSHRPTKILSCNNHKKSISSIKSLLFFIVKMIDSCNSLSVTGLMRMDIRIYPNIKEKILYLYSKVQRINHSIKLI